MFVFVLKLFSGLAFVSIVWMVRGETSLNSSASSDNKTARTRQRREKAIITLTQSERIAFLQAHNKFRNDVGNAGESGKPTAAGMMRMYWSAQLEASAVSRSKKCYIGAKDVKSEVTKLRQFTCALSQYGNTIGQTFFSAAHKPTVSEAFEYFANESQGFEYNKEKGGLCKSKGSCASYTQLVWQSSFLIGCGYAECENFYAVTCHYLPAGNQGNITLPFEDGPPCSRCASDTKYSFTECDGQLCVPKSRCSPVKECKVIDAENCLCSESDYRPIVSRMLKDVGAIHTGPPVVVFSLLLPLVAILLGQGAQLGYDSGLL